MQKDFERNNETDLRFCLNALRFCCGLTPVFVLLFILSFPCFSRKLIHISATFFGWSSWKLNCWLRASAKFSAELQMQCSLAKK